MAQDLLFNIAGEIIKNLGSQALQEIGLWWGLKDEFEKLKKTISAIQAVLLDAEEKSVDNNQVKDWLGKLKEVLYDADDLLDGFSTEALRRQVMDGNKVTKEVCLFFSRSNQFVYGIKMGHKIKAIRERLDSIAKDKQDYLEPRLAEAPFLSRGRDQTISFVEEEEVIGRENDKKAILNSLLDSDIVENVAILPIVGIGGLGKTTLAQYVYNDGEVKNHFELKIWVCVSEVFDIKVIVEKAIKSVKNKELGNLELDQLQCNLRHEISGKRYLLVLDDVWNEDLQKWLDLRSLLMCGAKGSRIIVTTRSEKVAAITGTLPHYSLGGLSSSQSWSLFEKIVFKGQKPKNLNVKNIGEKIINKCVGVPLAIRTIASVLYFKDPEIEWLQFLENDLSKIAQNENVILNTLKLSYNHLFSNLKHCFAYCALFPKDYEIDVRILTHLWIAQGFVDSLNKGQCVEDVAMGYFIDLWWRSFFQEVQRDEFGNVVSCKMHDLMHDLATLVGGEGIKLINSKSKRIDEKTYHVALGVGLELSPEQILNILSCAKQTRTFILLGYPLQYETHFSIKKIISSKFKNMRTCDVGNLNIEKMPSVKKQKHLRYINVSRTKIVALPNSICELHNLQVLNVTQCRKLKELPRDIRKLINLRHLYNGECHSLKHMPRGIGELTSLQTLPLFVLGDKNNKNVAGLSELKKLNNLRGSLAIRVLEKVKSESDNELGLFYLKEKQHLQSLFLNWETNDDVNVDLENMLLPSLLPHTNLKSLSMCEYGGNMLPTIWFSSLTNLVFVDISFCKRLEYLPPLNEIPYLQSLGIVGLPNLEYTEMGGATTFFPSLKYLSIEYCPKLMGWLNKRKNDESDDSTVSEQQLLQFPCLSEFSCSSCPKLTWLPHFPSLDEYLYLREVSAKLVEQILTPSISSSSFTVPPLSKLKNLRIWSIKDLESLPVKGLQNLTCLHELSIYDCPRLKSLPKEMCYLTSLRRLEISACPQLEERCRNNKGEDWPIISHIPGIEVGDKTIQQEGRNLVDEE